MPTKVVHCKREPYDVYIGRPGPWGNPYVIGMPMNGHPATREEVIEYSRDYFLQEIEAGRLDISALRGKTLGCWCSPKPCHGDVLAELADREDCPSCGDPRCWGPQDCTHSDE